MISITGQFEKKHPLPTFRERSGNLLISLTIIPFPPVGKVADIGSIKTQSPGISSPLINSTIVEKSDLADIR